MSDDLLLTHAHVVDPERGLDAIVDVAVGADRIVDVEAGVEGMARRVLDLSGPGRYVLPGLIDAHAHVAVGTTTRGVGMAGCDPDDIGVRSGVTTVVDAGSTGVGNAGALAAYVIPSAQTRVVCYLNVGSHAHTLRSSEDIERLSDIDEDAIGCCIEQNPGLVAGLKLRLVGDGIRRHGENVIARSKALAAAYGLPLMVHLGDRGAETPEASARMDELAALVVQALDKGDILTHICTPRPGGIVHNGAKVLPLAEAAVRRGVVLDAALGRNHFAYRAARELREAGLVPHMISTDLTAGGHDFHSLLECMAKFMAVGYGFSDVVRMTTSAPAAALRLGDGVGTLSVGGVADLSIIEAVEGHFVFVDALGETFTGEIGFRPVTTLRAGQLHEPGWGPHPWGWLPRSAAADSQLEAATT